MMDYKTPPPGFDPGAIIPSPHKEYPFTQAEGVAIDITGSCNMACRYCQETIALPKRPFMTEETLEAVWKYFFPNGFGKNSSLHLGVGEPFLNFPLMKKIRQLIRETETKGEGTIAVNVTTNGVLLEGEILDWVLETDWRYKVSLDGPARINDRWRILPDGTGSYGLISAAITRMVEKFPDKVTILSVVCPGADPAEIFKAAEDLGVASMEMNPMLLPGQSQPDPEDIEMYKAFIRDYCERTLKNDENKPKTLYLKFDHFIKRLMGYSMARVYCGAARNYLGVGPRGELYACARFSGLKTFQLGDVFNGLDHEALQRFQQGAGAPVERRQPCKDCWAAFICQGPCFAFAEELGRGNHRPATIMCQYELATAEAVFHYYNRVKEEDPEQLLQFLPGIEEFMFQ
jgi:uncharacterized protein